MANTKNIFNTQNQSKAGIKEFRERDQHTKFMMVPPSLVYISEYLNPLKSFFKDNQQTYYSYNPLS